MVENLKEALLKCATGLSASETVEEFTMDDSGELKLVKKKVTKRDIPPDIKAVKLLIDERGEPTDEELEEEKSKLLKLLDGQTDKN
ncbi:MAG: hypothetical protein K2K80_08190 [Clostridia bacterium]|nr:hypothetical protein [Clostridia bacterium]